MISRRSVIAAAPLTFAACTRAEEKYFGNTRPPNGQRLTMVLEGEPETIDPALADGIVDSLILSLFEGLTSLHPVSGEPMAGLATRYELSSDALRYKFYLRGHPKPYGTKLPDTSHLPYEYSRGRSGPPPGLRPLWSDSRLITAADFVYGWRRALTPSTAASRAFLLYAVRNGKAVNAGKLAPAQLGVRALDDLTLEVELEEPTPYFLELVSNRVAAAVPEHVIRVAGRRWTDPDRMVCSGPFRLRSRRPYDSIVIERNPFYYDAGQVSLDEITFIVPRERAVMVSMYRTGAATVVESLVPAILPILRRKKDFRAQRMYGSSFIAMNTAAPPFDDVRVRYALNMATNKQPVRQLCGAGNIPASSVIPPGADFLPLRALPVQIGGREYDVLAFNPEGAREILRTLPKPFPSRIEFFTSNDAENVLWADVLRDQWRKHLGVETEIVLADFPTWLQAVVNGTFRQLAASGSSACYIDPIWFLDIFNNRDGYGTHWRDPAYNELIAETKRTRDPTLRQARLAACERYLLRAMPILPQDHWVNAVMVKPYVRGLGTNLLDREQLKYVWIDANWRPA
jgi:ABC-type oligopeptide transport system substrate-binding subunit